MRTCRAALRLLIRSLTHSDLCMTGRTLLTACAAAAQAMCDPLGPWPGASACTSACTSTCRARLARARRVKRPKAKLQRQVLILM